MYILLLKELKVYFINLVSIFSINRVIFSPVFNPFDVRTEIVTPIEPIF